MRERVRQAVVVQRAVFAFFLRRGRRRLPGLQQVMRGDHAAFGFRPQRGIEGDGKPTALFAVKERAFGDGAAEHFFEADRLGAQLHGVGEVFFRLAALVFDRKRLPASRFARQGAAGRAAVKFNGVGLSAQAEPRRDQRQPARGDDLAALFASGLVDMLMQDVAQHGQAVVLPCLFKMNQGALARAKEVMLQR